jgi:hypothetical protein
MGSADGIKEALEKLTTTIEKMQASLDKLAPLAPVAGQVAAIPSKVEALQSSAFENTEQVRALKLAVIRVEKALNSGKGIPADDGDASAHSAAPKPGPPPYQYRHADDNNHDDSRFHPCVRLEFRTFDGKDDSLPWLNRCETFFRGQSTPEERRVWYAAMHLTGAAKLWYARLELMAGRPSWRRFAQLVQQRFRPPMTDSPLGELVRLCRAGTVDDYTDQFLALACRDADLSDHQLVQIYMAGLVNPLKTDVALRRPATLDDAIMLARVYEQRLELHPTDQPPGRGTRASTQASSASATTRVAAATTSVPAGSGKMVAVTSSLPRQRLSQAEMTQRRAEGLCFNCDEKYVQGHHCKKLFVLEIDDTDDEEVEEEIECSAITLGEELPGISLHAITGVRAKASRR